MDFSIITAIRQNHALEHATVSELVRRLGPNISLVGRATASGFYIYGDLPTHAIEEAAKEGLRRMQRGESELAISPLCGTNIVVAGILTGLTTALSLGRKNRLRRLPRAMMAAMLSILAARPLGQLAQKHITTSSSLSNVVITGVKRMERGRRVYHKIETARR
jgi:hypothetical protein